MKILFLTKIDVKNISKNIYGLKQTLTNGLYTLMIKKSDGHETIKKITLQNN